MESNIQYLRRLQFFGTVAYILNYLLPVQSAFYSESAEVDRDAWDYL